MSNYVNKTVKNLPPSGIRRFFDLVISAGDDVVSLGVGEPDFEAPWHVREAAIFALEKGFTGYTENTGLAELRNEISKYTQEYARCEYNPQSEIMITNGVSEAMDLAFRATIEKGDKILVPNPGYVMYEPLITLAGGKSVFYDPLRIDSIHKEEDIEGIVLNYPGNPLGNIFAKEELEKISKFAKNNDWIIYSDEIYGGLSYIKDHISMASFPENRERLLLFNGLSKTHAMTGMRIGWVSGPEEIIFAMNKIHQYSALCSSSVSQIAAVEALRRGEKEAFKMKETFDERRKYCIKRLNKMKLPFNEPQGAFYIFADISKYDQNDVEFCEELLRKEKLAVVPGSAFGSAGKGKIRMTFAADMKELEEAFDRLERFIN